MEGYAKSAVENSKVIDVTPEIQGVHRSFSPCYFLITLN